MFCGRGTRDRRGAEARDCSTGSQLACSITTQHVTERPITAQVGSLRYPARDLRTCVGPNDAQATGRADSAVNYYGDAIFGDNAKPNDLEISQAHDLPLSETIVTLSSIPVK